MLSSGVFPYQNLGPFKKVTRLRHVKDNRRSGDQAISFQPAGVRVGRYKLNDHVKKMKFVKL